MPTRFVGIVILTLASCPVLAQAQEDQNVRMLDQVCVADQARQCFETAMPAQVKGSGINGVNCPVTYKTIGNETCARNGFENS